VDVLFVVDGCAIEADVLQILGLTSYLFYLVGVIVVYRNVAQRPRQLWGFPLAAIGVVGRIGVVKRDEAVFGIRYGLVVRFLHPVCVLVCLWGLTVTVTQWDGPNQMYFFRTLYILIEKTVSLKLHVTLHRVAHVIYNDVGRHCFSGGEVSGVQNFLWLVN
jgi:hypothetical protein